MVEIKENPLFFLVLLFATITPFCFYSLLGLETLFVFGMMTLCSSLALLSLFLSKNSLDVFAFKWILLLFVTMPYVDMFHEMWGRSWFFVYWGIAFFVYGLNGSVYWVKWLKICVLSVLLFVPIALYFEYTTEKQDIIANRTQTLSGSIPESPSSFTKPCGKGRRCTFYFLDLAGVKFNCDLHSKKAMDKFICQDIYQHAGKTATAQYILENQKEARLVSLLVDNQTLWSPEQTLAWYQQREQTLWREFGAGLLLISLPFLLLFAWARKLTFQAA
ncbi:hypothetical protein [Wielerella bovis]|uniref:hypothetical protein n=1 Tax=Wielerella bovis TaxID=2917790 RepID=UPI00201908B3|nr:hypothetical protein [Wielerella bovis]MCG7657851.1 hypothetical protein [Wielerella bovis]MCG7660073.1 hypothetical protein [Wielerella bovis]